MFDGWQAFYQMTGGAAATLTGLLFIVASLTTGRQVSVTSAGVRLFTTPTVFHLVSVLVISALMLAPDGEGRSQSAIITVWSAGGLVYSVGRTVGLARLEKHSHWSDIWWYGFAPMACFLALAAASITACLRAPHAAYYVALCLTAQLVVAVRNAWDLVTWLAPRRGDP